MPAEARQKPPVAAHFEVCCAARIRQPQDAAVQLADMSEMEAQLAAHKAATEEQQAAAVAAAVAAAQQQARQAAVAAAAAAEAEAEVQAAAAAAAAFAVSRGRTRRSVFAPALVPTSISAPVATETAGCDRNGHAR